MDWSDERYVRLYVRDTATWKRLKWQGQTVLMHLLRRVDRKGFLEIRGEADAAAAIEAVTDLPTEVIDEGLRRLRQHDVVTITEKELFFPKFIEAQTATQSDAHRMRELRARKREEARHRVHEPVTHRNPVNTTRDRGEEPPKVTARNAPVVLANGPDTESTENVTLYCTVLSSTQDPDLSGDAEDLSGSPRETRPQRRRQTEPEPTRFRMRTDWKPNPDSIESVKIGSVADYAIPTFIAEFVGHFTQTTEECTDGEWNQRWQKWAHRGWNDSNRRPSPPASSGGAPAYGKNDGPLARRLLARKMPK